MRDVQITLGRYDFAVRHYLGHKARFHNPQILLGSCHPLCVASLLGHKLSDNSGFDVTGDFFRDLQEEFQNWEASAASQGKPKSLWEELAVRHSCLY